MTATATTDTAARWPRVAAACGLLYPALLILGDDVIGPVAGEAPGRGVPAEAVQEWALASNVPQFFAGRVTGGVIALLALLVFVSHVSVQLRRWDAGWLAGAALAAGTLAAGMQMLAVPAHVAAVRWAEQLDPAVTAAIAVDLHGVWGLAFVPLALFLLCVGVATVRGEVMARWLGWLGIAVGVGLIVGEYVTAISDTEVGLAFVPVLLLWFVWLPGASISLIRRARRAPQAVAQPVAPGGVAG